MARLLSWPIGLGLTEVEVVGGPQSIGSGSTQSMGNFAQTFASPFGLWAFNVSFPPLQGKVEREHRGWMTGLYGGANATRFTYIDAGGMTPAETGVNVADYLTFNELVQPWSNGQPWSNLRLWDIAPPVVTLASEAAKDSTVINLSDEFWGCNAGLGTYLGFSPFYLGMHIITEVIGGGSYRVWPPLRKTIAAGDLATLRPTLAVRLASTDGYTLKRSPAATNGQTAQFIETLDYDVRTYFGD